MKKKKMSQGHKALFEELICDVKRKTDVKKSNGSKKKRKYEERKLEERKYWRTERVKIAIFFFLIGCSKCWYRAVEGVSMLM